MKPEQPKSKKEPPISKTPNPGRPGAGIPEARLLVNGKTFSSVGTSTLAGVKVLGKAFAVASAVTTVVDVAQCFGDNPFLGGTAECVQFHLTDAATFGFMSLAHYGMTEFAEALDNSPESKRYLNNAINRATGIEEMNRKMDEMHKWGTVAPGGR